MIKFCMAHNLHLGVLQRTNGAAMLLAKELELDQLGVVKLEDVGISCVILLGKNPV